MNKHDPLLVAARQIHSALSHQPDQSSVLQRELADLDCHYDALQRVRRMIRTARDRGWHLAAGKCLPDLFTYIRCLHQKAGALLRYENQPETQFPSLGTIIAELQQLPRELQDVEIKPEDDVISACTDDIVLEDTSFGPFSIELDLKRLTDHQDVNAFDIIALEPNPASDNEDVTHPHVKEKQLCSGDATLPIAQALKQGRIADAFCLIRSVLHTYNPHSPYIAIENWKGFHCGECGRNVSGDDRCSCDECDGDTCMECSGCCDLCHRSICQSCLEVDDVSGRSCCSNCRSTCAGCDRTVDHDNYDSETGLCPQCRERREQESSEACIPAECAAIGRSRRILGARAGNGIDKTFRIRRRT